MYRCLAPVDLATGEQVEAGVVRAPDAGWARMLMQLLHGFEIGPWNEALEPLLTHDLGAEVWFYVLHRDGVPFSGMMTVEDRGVGLRGNVWTQPKERRRGACASLMALQMNDFQVRGGQALHLFTDYGSVAYRIYWKFGFQGVEPRSGHMAYYASAVDRFEQAYFAPGETCVDALEWGHLAAAHALFMGGYPGLMRCAPLGLVGRWSPEWPLVRLLHEESKRRDRGERPRATVLRVRDTGAVAGFATWTWLSHRRSTCLVDVYCHPAFWDEASRLLEALNLPDADRVIAYADADCKAKSEVLMAAGFQQAERLRNVPVNWCRSEIGFLPQSKFSALLAGIASPAMMALRRLRPRQGGTVNSSTAKMDLTLFEKR